MDSEPTRLCLNIVLRKHKISMWRKELEPCIQIVAMIWLPSIQKFDCTWGHEVHGHLRDNRHDKLLECWWSHDCITGVLQEKVWPPSVWLLCCIQVPPRQKQDLILLFQNWGGTPWEASDWKKKARQVEASAKLVKAVISEVIIRMRVGEECKQILPTVDQALVTTAAWIALNWMVRVLVWWEKSCKHLKCDCQCWKCIYGKYEAWTRYEACSEFWYAW